MLKRLELHGFKSFAGKTILDFPKGVVAIVGPNGSGKSNIADALRWILGEKEARELRSAKADDLIFAGTEKRPRMGLAQASLAFDNSSGAFPVEFGEVVVMRRIDRSGDSTFSLNGAEVRLKDIVDFFAKSRLGARGLTVVGQGASDSILRASSRSRREMIEEILGLKEYLTKKNAASRELGKTELNLREARARLGELLPHVRMLERQLARYDERAALEKKADELAVEYYGRRAEEIARSAEDRAPERERLEEARARSREECARKEKEVARVEGEMRGARESLERIRAERRELLNRYAGESAEREPAEPVMTTIRRIAERALEETRLEDVRGALKKIAELAEDGAPRRPAARRTEAAGELKEAVGALDAREKEHSERSEKLNDLFREAVRRAEEARRKVFELDEEEKHLKLRGDEAARKRAELEAELREEGRTLAEIERRYAGSACDERDLERAFRRIRGELAAIGEVDEATRREALEARERHASLESQVRDLEEASGNLRGLVAELEAKIENDFCSALARVNGELKKYAHSMLDGGRIELSALRLAEGAEGADDDAERTAGIEIEVSLPRKKLKGLDALSGGERSLVSIAILFALIAIGPPPFLVLDEVDAHLDERNARKFGELLKELSRETQFVVVTHNRATMEAAHALYGITMAEDGTSKVVSLKLEG